MRIGIIDLGTNSVRFDVHLIGRKNQVRLLHREKLMIRLGEGVFLSRKLNPSAIRRTLYAFMSFRRTATLLQAEKVIAFGTSALREAEDSERLIDLIQRKTGIDIRVISGNEEAHLIALGILSHEQPFKGRFGLVDIGGGSTEISICQNQKILRSSSFPLGTARLQQVFLKTSPPRSHAKVDPILSLRESIRNTILPKMDHEEWPKVKKIMGSSGTIRALERVLKKETGKDGIQRRDLAKLVKTMSGLSKAQLLRIPGIEAKRCDMILSGAILLEECMDALEATDLKSTNYSLRDGILAREMMHFDHQSTEETRFTLADVISKAQRLGFDAAHLLQISYFSEVIFEKTKKIHRLHPEWKLYFCAANILRNIGEVIAPTHHELHSYYIIRNSDFFAMEKWESDFIGQLCLKHNRPKLTKKDVSFTKDRSKRQAFIRLLALMGIVDALDHGHASRLHIKKITIKTKKLRITLSGADATDLDILRIEQKKQLFEQVFRTKINATKSNSN
jgi:exopolyphosphatase/guanosine-5'-triphosphate,3'-diphosphate pyrophosphatase